MLSHVGVLLEVVVVRAAWLPFERGIDRQVHLDWQKQRRETPELRGHEASVLKMCGKRDLSGFRQLLPGIGCDVPPERREDQREDA